MKKSPTAIPSQIKKGGSTMTRVRMQEVAAQAIVLGLSGAFLLTYIAAKLAVWPWGAYSY